MGRPNRGNLFTIDFGALDSFLDVSKASNSAAKAIPFLTFTTFRVDRQQRRRTLDSLQRLNRTQERAMNDPTISTRIAQYELAFRMQMSVPELIDVKREPKAFGACMGPRRRGWQICLCLLARRLAERGVRFIQLYHRTGMLDAQASNLNAAIQTGNNRVAAGLEATRHARRDPGHLGQEFDERSIAKEN